MAVTAEIMSLKVFSIVIWALLYATIFAPIVFRKVLANYAAKLREDSAPAVPETVEAGKASETKSSGFRFEIEHPKGDLWRDSNLQDAVEIVEILKKYKVRIAHSVQHSD